MKPKTKMIACLFAIAGFISLALTPEPQQEESTRFGWMVFGALIFVLIQVVWKLHRKIDSELYYVNNEHWRKPWVNRPYDWERDGWQ